MSNVKSLGEHYPNGIFKCPCGTEWDNIFFLRWWCLDDSIRILQEKLDNDNYIVVDNFLSPLDAELLKEQV